jgi:hypothetical protein
MGFRFLKLQRINSYIVTKDIYEVQKYFNNQPNKLIVLDWEKGDGWIELCEFLGKPVPSLPFPHANKGQYKPKKKNLINSLLTLNIIWK